MGDRRQKALRARLAAMQGQRAQGFARRAGTAFGRVRSAGPRGAGIRIAQNGAARPGALSFLQASGFLAGRSEHGPAMRPVMPQFRDHHAPTALPTEHLGDAPLPTPPDVGPHIPTPADVGPHIPTPADVGPYIALPTNAPPGTTNGLVPLGGGRYFDPATGVIHGGGGGGRPQSVL